MKIAKRAMLYILRKKGKTISLFLFLFIVAIFLISCFEILNASETLSKEIRTSLGASFYLRARTGVSMGENGEARVSENGIDISQKQVDEIMGMGEVKICNPINYGFAKSNAIRFIPGEKHSEESNMGKVIALAFSALAPDFTDEAAVLAEGRHITEADQRKILVSEQLAKANSISVGDVITLTHAKLGECAGEYIDEIPVKTAFVQVEVSGIYKLKVEDTAMKPTAGVSDNAIYASLDVLNELNESERGIYTGEVDFYITDPAKLNDVTRNVQLLSDIDWTTHFIRSNDFQYSKIADQLSALGDLVKILLACVSVVSAALLTLILMLRIRGRMQEAGIFLAVGISKKMILGQFLLEILFVAIVAFIFAYAASFGITGLLEMSLFREMHPNLLNDQTIAAGVNSSMDMNSYLKLGIGKIMAIYLCQLIVITVSTLVSGMAIVRLKPKEILSKMS